MAAHDAATGLERVTRAPYPESGGDAGAGRMETAELRRAIEQLRVEHRDLDAGIAALAAQSGRDELQLARMKKRKLRLKDEISRIEDQLVPDIIA